MTRNKLLKKIEGKHHDEKPRYSRKGRATSGGPTEDDPERPYCKEDQSCCDFTCGN